MRDFSKLESLRKRAEELVGSDRIISDPSLEQVDDLVHELNVYRGELELQSSDLLDAHVALERSLATWRNFFDESSSFFIILDGNHCVRAINRAALEFLRLDISRIEGQPVYGLFPAPRRPEVKVFLSRIFNNMLRNEQHLTIRCFVEDDLVETQLQARCIGRDEELALLVQLADFRELAELHTERMLIEEAFAHTLEPTFIADRAAVPRILFHNNRLLSFLGVRSISPGQSLRSTMQHLLEEPRLNALVDAIRCPEETTSCVFPIESNGLTRWFNCALKAIDTPTGFRGTIGSIKELDQGNGVTEDTERYRLLGLVAGGAAHDFSNLINIANTLIATGQLLSKQDEDLQETFQELGAIMQHTQHLAEQVTSIMRDVRPSDEQVAVFESLKFISSTLHHMVGPASNLKLHFDLDAGDLVLDMAAINLWQVTFNLVSNARDHATSNVWVSAREEIIDDDKPYHMRVPNGVALHLIVEDDGPGVNNEIANTIFAPTVTSREGGTGLGLATVDWIVKRQRGAVWFEDRKGGGAIFHVLLPGRKPSSEDNPEEA
jgi:nitrogen-specific signal transduction histidine kinase